MSTVISWIRLPEEILAYPEGGFTRIFEWPVNIPGRLRIIRISIGGGYWGPWDPNVGRMKDGPSGGRLSSGILETGNITIQPFFDVNIDRLPTIGPAVASNTSILITEGGRFTFYVDLSFLPTDPPLDYVVLGAINPYWEWKCILEDLGPAT
jgi:hypothetical protein